MNCIGNDGFWLEHEPPWWAEEADEMEVSETRLITMAELCQKFAHVPKKTLRWWVVQGLIPYSASTKDGRGIVRLFSPDDVAKAEQFVKERFEIRQQYRIRREP